VTLRPRQRPGHWRRFVLAGAVLASALGIALPVPSLAVGPSAAGPSAGGGPAGALSDIVPPFTIWDVKLGHPVSEIPDADIVNVACGTNGGPPALQLKNFTEFAKCPAEPSGLHEVHFEYDDEEAYVAKAMELEYRYLQAGTSVYAHPVVLSVLVDDKGIARGIRILSDDRASVRDRRLAAALEDNLRARFEAWTQDCRKFPPTDGEESVGPIFVHDLCVGKDPATGEQFRLEARFMRLKGQVGIDPVTQQVQKESFFSLTRFELVEPPYKPFEPAQPAGG
jgi:hypothetical protein